MRCRQQPHRCQRRHHYRIPDRPRHASIYRSRLRWSQLPPRFGNQNGEILSTCMAPRPGCPSRSRRCGRSRQHELRLSSQPSRLIYRQQRKLLTRLRRSYRSRPALGVFLWLSDFRPRLLPLQLFREGKIALVRPLGGPLSVPGSDQLEECRLRRCRVSQNDCSAPSGAQPLQLTLKRASRVRGRSDCAFLDFGGYFSRLTPLLSL